MADYQVSIIQLVLLVGLAGYIWLIARMPESKYPRRDNWRSVWIVAYVAVMLAWEASYETGFHLRYVFYAVIAVVLYSGLVFIWNLAEPKD